MILPLCDDSVMLADAGHVTAKLRVARCYNRMASLDSVVATRAGEPKACVGVMVVVIRLPSASICTDPSVPQRAQLNLVSSLAVSSAVLGSFR